ncbi:unnamed protein product, partial [marine sediment metagenome]
WENEGISVNVNEEACIGCGKCVEVCVFGGRELVDGKAKIDQDRCLGCGRCADVNEEACIGCGKCVEVCVFGGRELVDGKAKIDQDRCLGCGRCADVCPTGATTIKIDDINRVEELIGKIESMVDVRDQATLEE